MNENLKTELKRLDMMSQGFNHQERRTEIIKFLSELPDFSTPWTGTGIGLVISFAIKAYVEYFASFLRQHLDSKQNTTIVLSRNARGRDIMLLISGKEPFTYYSTVNLHYELSCAVSLTRDIFGLDHKYASALKKVIKESLKEGVKNDPIYEVIIQGILSSLEYTEISLIHRDNSIVISSASSSTK